jgi:hypothetical protein
LFWAKNLNVKLCFGFFEGRTGRRGIMGGRRAYEKKGDLRFLFSLIRPILSLLLVLNFTLALILPNENSWRSSFFFI